MVDEKKIKDVEFTSKDELNAEQKERLQKTLNEIHEVCVKNQAGLVLQAEQVNGGVYVKMIVIDNPKDEEK